MPDLFAWVNSVPEWGEDIPGVWKNRRGSGYRVPYNVHGLFNWALPGRFALPPPQRVREMVRDRSGSQLAQTLRPYQVAALQHAWARDGYNVWAPCGAGKTLTGLVWSSRYGSRLVVTRAAARETWREEVLKWTSWEPALLLGRTPEPVVPKPGKVYITAWETLLEWGPTLGGFDALVIDESHWTIQRKRAKPVVMPDGETIWQDLHNTSAVVRKLAEQSSHRLLLTATPIPTKVMNLWPQLDLAEPWQWGGSRGFGLRYCGAHHNGYGMTYDGASNLEELNERLRFSKHLTRQSTLSKSLPPKRRQVWRLPRSEQDKPASGFKRDIKRAARDDANSLFEVLLMEAATRKRTVVVERVVEACRSGQKVLVFTGRIRDCEHLGESIRKALGKAALSRAELWVAHGSTPDRDGVRRAYMAAKGPAVLVGTRQAWGESVNLQDTDLFVVAQLPSTPLEIVQSEGRVSRLGQQRPVMILYMVALGTVDEDVADSLLGRLPPVVELVENEDLEKLERSFRPPPTRSLLERVAGL